MACRIKDYNNYSSTQREMPEINHIYHGDCVDTMKHWVDKCVDLVITDPPYGIDFSYNQYKDSFDMWIKLMSACIPEWHRVCRGPIIFPSCSLRGREWLWKNAPPRWTICWYKGSPGHCAAIGFNDWEDIHVMGDKIHRNVHDHFFAKPTDLEINGHPCPKSIGWASWIIAHFSDEGSVILDTFCGSGTSLVAAERLNRKWIGCELNIDYAKLASDRVNAECNQLKLFS